MMLVCTELIACSPKKCVFCVRMDLKAKVGMTEVIRLQAEIAHFDAYLYIFFTTFIIAYFKFYLYKDVSF